MSFTCEECRQKQNLDHGPGYPFMGISRGRCEDCGNVADCEDLHGAPKTNFGDASIKDERKPALGSLAAIVSEPTYWSLQHTACAVCREDKHTPLRRDELGGYVCLTCIDKRLSELEASIKKNHLPGGAYTDATNWNAAVGTFGPSPTLIPLDEVFTWKEDFLDKARQAFGSLVADASPLTYGDLKSRCDKIDRELDPFFEHVRSLAAPFDPALRIHMVKSGAVPDGILRACQCRLPPE